MPMRRSEEKMDEEEVEVEVEVEVEQEETAAGDVALIESLTRELKSCARPVRRPAHAESVSAAMVAVDRGDLTKRA